MSPETIRLAGSESSQCWWDRYATSLRDGGLTETARQVVELDTEYIVEKGIFGAGEPGSKWPPTRVRRGLVIGSVQSGKTASMLGVTAMALDRGVDVVAILTGTRVALWRQTVDRTLGQLDRWTPRDDAERRLRRILLPPPREEATGQGMGSLGDLYFEHPSRVRRMLEMGRPVIAVVMKQVDHLIRFRTSIRSALETAVHRLDRPIHMLVIDDEADDGSILDAVVEAGLDADSLQLKQIPRHIARIWSSKGEDPQTFNGQVYASYVAYTATPQANILQSDHNPLSPTDFVVSLRVPFDSGDIFPPRYTTFEEPQGLTKYYTGGELFYRIAGEGEGALSVRSAFPESPEEPDAGEYEESVEAHRLDLLGNALRAFFVAAAVRLLEGGRSLVAATSLAPATEQEVKAASPEPCTMLIHPSAAIDEQVFTTQVVAKWTGDPNLDSMDGSGCPTDEAGNPVIDAEGLNQRLDKESERWRTWFEDYIHSRRQLSERFPRNGFRALDSSEWQAVERTLRSEVFPSVGLRMINSDPRADDRPVFRPRKVEGGYVAAPDLCSIFVSGNVMARGVTLEGLTTTLFLRSTSSPTADTQMQMQRWFGYRGDHLDLCRVFLYEDQFDLFRAYHENDEALRIEVISEMNAMGGTPPSPLVLQGHNFRATSKIANLRALPLHPGPHPFVRVIADGAAGLSNLSVFADLLERGVWEPVAVGGTVRGLIWDQSLPMLEVAQVLERLLYPHHDPDPSDRIHRRWGAVARHLKLQAPLYRPPENEKPAREAVNPPSCPYAIAAYLRLWAAALTSPAPGLYPTDNYRTPWSMINRTAYAATAPMFHVGVRFGEAGRASDPRLAAHDIECVTRACEDGRVKATWGSRNPGEGPEAYMGDQMFDYHATGDDPPSMPANDTFWRPRGHPGLLLFHVLRIPQGETVVPALAIPIGGPDHFAALAPVLERN
jgi:hypothetical protein